MPRLKSHQIDLYARLTHQYVTGWAGEDQWVPLAPVRSTGPTAVTASPGAYEDDDTDTRRHLLTFAPAAWVAARYVYRRNRPAHAGQRLGFIHWLEWMASENFSTGCRHEHDCCGCRLTRASATYIGKRRFSLELHHFHNV
jgi:hypothetical protein